MKVGSVGFEPTTASSQGTPKYVCKPYEMRIENGKEYKLRIDSKILSEFTEFCKVDLRLKDSTIREHCINIRKFFKTVRKPLSSICIEDLRSYLNSLNKSDSHYRNQIKSLRRFFRDFLNRKDLVATFKLPSIDYRPKILPSKEELKIFYEALPTQKLKAIFLFYATTGLRRKEVLDLTLENLDLKKRMVLPKRGSNTKRVWLSFYNDEAENKDCWHGLLLDGRVILLQ